MSTEDEMRLVPFIVIMRLGEELTLALQSAEEARTSLYLTLVFPSMELREKWESENVTENLGHISKYDVHTMKDDGRLVRTDTEVVENITGDLTPVEPTLYYMASGAPLIYGPARVANRASVERFWQDVADLAAKYGLSVGGGLLTCDEEGEEVGR